MKLFGTDYDGVIINIELQKAKAFASLLYKRWGVLQEEAEQFWLKTGGTPRRYKFDYLYQKQFHKKLNDEDYRNAEREYSELLKKEYYPNLQLKSHAKEVLTFARKNFNHTFVSSGVPMQEIRYLVNLNSLNSYFNLILGTDDHYKSKKDHFHKIITLYKPDLIVYIADGIEDMKIAKEFGANSIGIPTNISQKELLNAGATYVCSLPESISIMNEILNL